MHGEIITIGNELISGRTLDLNGWYAAGRLTASGLKVTGIATVGDDPEEVTKALIAAVERSGFVIVTGGLGSTEDDMTNQIVAEALDRPLCLDQQMLAQIKSYVAVRGIEMSASLEKMAWMPKGSKILNPEGNMCGFSLIEDKVRLYFLPGVPDQMRYLMDKFVLPEILLHVKTLPVQRQRILKLYGLNEPDIAERLKNLPRENADVLLGFYPRFPENHITISLRGRDELTVMEELDRAEQEVRALLGPFIFATGVENMEDEVGEKLRTRGLTISVAESCTGGLISNLLTNAPGSSDYFMGGMVVYSNRSKIEFLHVSEETIEKEGAVSDRTVREMTEGVKKKMGTDLGLAVTGIAGPAGGSVQKPVGTVYIGLSTDRETFSGRYRFWGTRKQIKLNTAMMSLDWVRRFLNGDPFLSGV
jgi:nicotinamide-nucleotide amidase